MAYPHILDTVFDSLPIESLPSASQVNHQWRARVKSRLDQVDFFVGYHQWPEKRLALFMLKPGIVLKADRLLEEHRIRVLLALCDVFDMETEGSACECEEDSDLARIDPRLFSNLKVYRIKNCDSEGLRVMYIKTPSTPRFGCICRRWLQWEDVSRVVFTIRHVDWSLEELLSEQESLPERFDSITIIYLPMTDVEYGSAWEEAYKAHWHLFRRIVDMAWNKGKVITIVNASSLDTLEHDPLHADVCFLGRHAKEDEVPEDALRGMAMAALAAEVLPIDTPGPISPVQFVSLEEYRAHVGEADFATDTEMSWIPKTTR